MNDNMKRFLCGMLTGLASKGVMPESKREPVAYLYNGVRLPPLPAVDGYSYHIIRQNNTSNRYDAIYATSNFYVGYTDGCAAQAINMTTTIVYSMPLDKSSEWAYYETNPNKGYGLDGNRILVYSNADVYTSTGMTEIYFAASDPIPVYE